MMDIQNEAVLAAVGAEWERTRNLDLAHRFAAENPALADEIYELVAMLIEIDAEPLEAGEARERVDARTRAYLEAHGFAQAVAQRRSALPTTATSPLQALGLATGKSVPDIAAAMRMTTTFLLGGLKAFAVFPSRAQGEFLQRAHQASGITTSLLRDLIVQQKSAPAALAAKTTAKTPKPLTYDRLVKEGGLEAISPDEPRFWLSLKDSL
jgi:hypothetical protein